MAREGVVVRGVPVTNELYDIILFLTHSFVRPVVSELYAIKHNDVTVAENPKRLIVVVRNGNTGSRAAKFIKAGHEGNYALSHQLSELLNGILTPPAAAFVYVSPKLFICSPNAFACDCINSI